MTDTNQSWIELLSIIAHDLKTPISAVKGFIELIQYSGPLNDRQKHFSERAFGGLQQMERLISMLMDVAWIDADSPLDLGMVDIADLIRESATLMESICTQREITLDVNISASLGVVLGDSRRISQVINNLLSNAVKYNRDGGTVWVNASGDHDMVTISVRDTGMGIPAEDQAMVFERFFRSKTSARAKVEGTGLGLAIVKAIVERHQGQVQLESTPEQGSTFTITLPRRPRAVDGDSPETDEVHDLLERSERFDFMSVYPPSEQTDALDDDLQESSSPQPLDGDVDEI